MKLSDSDAALLDRDPAKINIIKQEFPELKEAKEKTFVLTSGLGKLRKAMEPLKVLRAQLKCCGRAEAPTHLKDATDMINAMADLEEEITTALAVLEHDNSGKNQTAVCEWLTKAKKNVDLTTNSCDGSKAACKRFRDYLASGATGSLVVALVS